MYSKSEIVKKKQAFWTTFGKYMSPVLSFEGTKVNWINYKTGKKDISFRMNADTRNAIIYIELTHSDSEDRLGFYERFQTFKPIFDLAISEEWIWEKEHLTEDGKSVSRIYKQIKGINILDDRYWPEIISFFKPRIIALDQFWTEIKDGFEDL